MESERLRLRVTSVDIVRGAVMVLMALDHVRVYAGVPAGGPTAGVFLTRWVTHFCAPAFFFLAGASAFLRGPGPSDAPSLPRWLATRGALLVVLELTLIRFAWTFNFDYAHSILAGVIWALGWSMILLAAVEWLPLAAIATLGLVLIAGHDLVPLLLGAKREALLAGTLAPFLRVLYFGGAFPVDGSTEPNFFVLYSIVPWWGVLCAGYAFGRVLKREPAARRRWCLRAGTIAIALFLLLRATELYGDRPWRPAAGEEAWAPAWIMFLATTKYPASLQFLLMTLGPTLVALGLLEGARDRVSRALMVFGRVPMFFYLLHIPLIHLLALAIAAIRTPQSIGWLFSNHPAMPPPPPEGYRWPLPLLYAITALAVGLLYPLCRAYDRGKAARRWKWAIYI
jgi:uncharacterized membrane protein